MEKLSLNEIKNKMINLFDLDSDVSLCLLEFDLKYYFGVSELSNDKKIFYIDFIKFLDKVCVKEIKHFEF